MWNPYKTPSPLQMATRELEEAQRDKLSHEAKLEYYRHMAQMLDKRISRLRTRVTELSQVAKDEREQRMDDMMSYINDNPGC
jgi:hypothetical protein